MSPERYQRITALVESAIELPPGRRDEFLREACAGDEELLRECTGLMAAHEQSGEFLQAPAIEFLAPDLADDLRPSDFTGQRIGRYRVVRLLGTGGMGEVWLAHDDLLAREIALKLLPPESAYDPSQALRFQREALAASALNHPNIVTIYEIGNTRGAPFIAQEFVPGETLRQRLASGPLKLATALEIGSQIAAALTASHQAGIVHRDIKPENVMLRPDGLVKVLDFGLARFVNPSARNRTRALRGATAPGMVLGTVSYMSPEQVRGKDATAASDLFSLGVVIYEMIAGFAPFTGLTPTDVMAAVLKEEPAPLARQRTGPDAQVEAIVRRCLRKDPAARYPSASELRSDLTRLVRSIEVDGQVAGRDAPKRWLPRRALIAVAAVLLLLAVAAAIYRGRGEGASAWSPGAMHVSRLAVRSGVVDAVISPNGRLVAYALDDAGGQSLWIRQVAAASDFRIRAPEPGDHRGLSFSPDSQYLYYVCAKEGGTENLYRAPVAGGEAQEVLAGVNSPIAFAPGGRQFAFVRLDLARRETDLMIAGTDGGGERRLAARRSPASYSQSGLAWSPDGRTIACLGNSGGADAATFNLVGVRVTDGKEAPISSHGWSEPNSVVWPADGRTVVVTGKEHPQGVQQIWAVSERDGVVRRITNDLDSYSRISLTADGQSLAAVQTQTTADIWVAPSGDSGRAARVTSGSFPALDGIAWTPDGRIVFAALGGDFSSIWTMNADGGAARQLTSGPGYGNELAVTPDGRYILFQYLRNIWRIDANGSHRMQLTHGDLDVHPSASSAGAVIYGSFEGWSPMIGGKPLLWKTSIDGGTPVQLMPAPASLPEVSPDGRLLACLYFLGDDPRFSRSEIAILPATGGPPRKLLDRPADAGWELHWPGNAMAVDYVRTVGGADNIWRQMVDGGAPVKVTDFRSDRVYTFAWSRDGARLALVRGKSVSDIVLITGFR